MAQDASPLQTNGPALAARARQLQNRVAALGARWEAVDPGLKLAIWVVLVLRVGLELVGFVSAQWEAVKPRGLPGWLLAQVGHGEVPGSFALSVWQRWNGLWYQYLALHGYHARDGTLDFQPLFPLLSRAASLVLGGNIVLAELTTTSLALGAAVWLLYRLARLDVGPVVSGLAVLLMVFFVSGFYLAAPYTESLYLALAAGCILLARRGRFWLAGAAGGAATLASSFGIFLVLPLLAEHSRQRRAQGRLPGPSALAALSPVLALTGLRLFWAAALGQRGVSWHTEGDWGNQLVFPWQAIEASGRYIDRTGDPLEILNLLALLGFLTLGVFVVMRLPAVYAWYVVPCLVFLLCHESGRTPLTSDLRYVLVLFPCFIVLAQWLAPKRDLVIGWLTVSAMLEVLLFEYWVHFHWVA